MNQFGFWPDKDLYDSDDEADAFITKETEKHRRFCEVSSKIDGEPYDPETCRLPQLTEELIRYHIEFKPHRIADIIYERIG